MPPFPTSNGQEKPPPRFQQQAERSDSNKVGTEDQQIHLRYKLAPATSKELSTIGKSPDRRAVLEKACHAAEFRSFPIKQAEFGFFREINDQSPVPYIVREAVSQPWHKVFLLVQIDLSGRPWPNKISAAGRKDLLKDSGHIHKLLDRVLRCLIDILGDRRDGRGVAVALDVLRSVKARSWEGAGTELLQVEGIGQVKMDRLVDAGVKSITKLSTLEFYHIERLLSRNPPFGQRMRQQLSGFPILRLKVDAVREDTSVNGAERQDQGHPYAGVTTGSHQEASVAMIEMGYENEAIPKWKGGTPWVTLVIESGNGHLLWFWRGSMKRLEGGKKMYVRLEAKSGEQLTASLACEAIVGTKIQEAFRW